MDFLTTYDNLLNDAKKSVLNDIKTIYAPDSTNNVSGFDLKVNVFGELYSRLDNIILSEDAVMFDFEGMHISLSDIEDHRFICLLGDVLKKLAFKHKLTYVNTTLRDIMKRVWGKSFSSKHDLEICVSMNGFFYSSETDDYMSSSDVSRIFYPYMNKEISVGYILGPSPSGYYDYYFSVNGKEYNFEFIRDIFAN